jgi:ubiquinone/menaquinone biosynthesis C-methylase UbiE/acyl carrier protein
MDLEKTYIIDGSYKLESFTMNMESEISRLKYQVDLFYQKEIALYKKIGLKDGMNIIECGSGPGFLLANIVRDFPDCKATAVEIDPHLVEQLTRSSSDNGKKLFEVIHASIYDTGLPDSYFDFAVARLVLEHLEDPDNAIAEVRRILKPGGYFVIVSNDFSYHLITYPPIAELDKMYSAYIESRFSEGGNPLIARQLPSILKKARFESINIEIICVHSELEGDKAFLKAENVNISKSLVNKGFLKEEILESLILNWYKMLQNPDHSLYRQLFVVSGTKDARNSVGYLKTTEIGKKDTFGQAVNIDSIKDLNPAMQESALGSYFINKLKIILEQQDLELILDAKLSDIDIDSIAAAELTSIIKSDFNTVISISDILQRLSISDIISIIIKNISTVQVNSTNTGDTEKVSNWLEGEL